MEIKGLNINYEIKGSGKKIFLFHGWGASLELYKIITDNLAKRYEVIAMDFPGFGGSEEPKEVLDVYGFALIASDFIKNFTDEGEEIILFGHSFGGRVIIKMLGEGMLQGIVVTKIILTGSAGIVPKRTLKNRLKVLSYKVAKKFVSPKKLSEIQGRVGSSDYKNASPVMRGCLVKAVNEDLKHYMGGIEIETLLIWGEEDSATPIGDGILMEKLFKNAGLARIKGAGHFAFIDNPNVFNAILDSYL